MPLRVAESPCRATALLHRHRETGDHRALEELVLVLSPLVRRAVARLAPATPDAEALLAAGMDALRAALLDADAGLLTPLERHVGARVAAAVAERRLLDAQDAATAPPAPAPTDEALALLLDVDVATLRARRAELAGAPAGQDEAARRLAGAVDGVGRLERHVALERYVAYRTLHALGRPAPTLAA